MISRRAINYALAVALCLTPQLASAHLVSTRFGEFYSGLLHPLTTLAHLVPWIAFGLVAGNQKLSLTRISLLYFPAAVFLGVLIGAKLPARHLFEIVNIVTFGAGALAALAVSLPRSALLSLLIICGLCHGIANSVSTLPIAQILLYAAGVALAAYLLLIFVATAAYVLIQRVSWGQVAVRALGSWVVAIGLMYGGYSLLILRSVPQ
ncbi:hydrogenase/urease accessory protein HupE [Alteromonadaceae bacterium 2753L.S.0a.02]|nr:hydrogenase/urease accessory protein HupE [Alteromonadaceae bacterium 2753L.S.0a.02]